MVVRVDWSAPLTSLSSESLHYFILGQSEGVVPEAQLPKDFQPSLKLHCTAFAKLFTLLQQNMSLKTLATVSQRVVHGPLAVRKRSQEVPRAVA